MNRFEERFYAWYDRQSLGTLVAVFGGGLLALYVGGATLAWLLIGR